MRPQSQTQFIVGGRLRITFGVNLICRKIDRLIFEQDGVGHRAEKLYEIVDNAALDLLEGRSIVDLFRTAIERLRKKS